MTCQSRQSGRHTSAAMKSAMYGLATGDEIEMAVDLRFNTMSAQNRPVVE
jgi:hypothetical protein